MIFEATISIRVLEFHWNEILGIYKDMSITIDIWSDVRIVEGT